MWIIYAFSSALFSGVTSIFAKCGIKNTDSNVATALRTIIILVFSWIMVFIKGSQNTIQEISVSTLLFLVLSGFATGASWLCYFRALQLGNVNKVVSIDKSSTVLTMILAIIFLGEGLTLTKLIAMILIAIGTYMMVQKKQEKEVAKQGYKWLLYAFGSAIFASLTSILGKVGIAGVDSTLGTAIRTIVVLIMAWLVVIVTGKIKTVKSIDKNSWIFLSLSGLSTGGAWLCYYRALQIGPASSVVPIDKLSIVVTIVFSYFFLKEEINKKALTGLILIVIGTLSLLI